MNAVNGRFSSCVFGAVFILIRFLQVVQGYSPLEASVMTMSWILAPRVVAPLAGMLAARLGTRTLIMTGVALGVAVALLAAFWRPTPKAWPHNRKPLQK
ncbi:hypothetical protein AAGW05_04710 [Arthrobacter sp. LAPM80]|uniref:hypothetical protein n=1 Tax=Arthrobacter sp. LAPM80 TaxID=3141788 RepID=UPI00398B6535